jgi:hypothetical protein
MLDTAIRTAFSASYDRQYGLPARRGSGRHSAGSLRDALTQPPMEGVSSHALVEFHVLREKECDTFVGHAHIAFHTLTSWSAG